MYAHPTDELNDFQQIYKNFVDKHEIDRETKNLLSAKSQLLNDQMINQVLN